MKISDTSLARLAGATYFLLAALGIYSHFYLDPLLAGKDAAGTAALLLGREDLFHLQKALGTFSMLVFLLVVWLLHRLFEPVDAALARLMTWLVLVCIPVGLMSDALEITALQVFKNGMPGAFTAEQSQALAMLYIRIGQNAGQMLTFFWGLWLLPLGILVYRSGRLPKLLGILLLINGLGYVVHCFAFLLFPDQLNAVLKWIYPSYFAGEIPFILWLLAKGLR